MTKTRDLADWATEFPNGVIRDQILTFTQTGTGATQRTVEDKLKDVVSVKDFGTVGDGVADDTAALIAAMSYCRSADKVLLVEGNVVINAASVPGATSYIDGCSMRGNGSATITVNGFVGFNMQGVNDTIVENLRIVTNGRERTEASNPSTFVSLFNSASGTKNNAVYRDLTVLNNVTSTTGEYRADPVIRETGCQQCLFENIAATNATIVLTVNSSNNILIRGVTGTNVQTNVYLSSVSNYRIQNCSLVNTKQQADYWVGRTFSTPKAINGMDNVLVEQGDDGVILGLLTEWAIERSAYVQSSNVTVADCYARNCDGYKLVGNSYTSQVTNVNAANCTLVVDNDWAATRGRANISLFTVYWASNVNLNSSFFLNTRSTLTNAVALLSVGHGDGSTVTGLYIKNCTAINVSQFVTAWMAGLTAAQLAALSPAGSFLVTQNVVIENCYYQSADFRSSGALYANNDTTASTDAKATYAANNIALVNNRLRLASVVANRDDWFFDIRYMDGVRSVNNAVDLPFANNGLFASLMTSFPHQNIYMNEQGMWHTLNNGTVVTRLANFNLLKDSSLKFTGPTSATTVTTTVSSLNTQTGTPSTGLVTIEAFGKGYLSISTADSWAIQMCANGLHYFGRVMAGTRTDQVGTPPITITPTASVIDIRGDLAPTVLYSARLIKV